MKVKFNNKAFFVIMIIVLNACSTQRTSTIVGCDYNKSKNITDYFVIPYGYVSLPGKWEKLNYNSVSRQQFFKNQDSIIVAVSFGRYNKYEFNMDGSLIGYDFIEAFYEWDSKYFVDSFGLKRNVIESDTANNFMIYRIYDQIEKGKLDTYFLIKEKNGNIFNFSISKTDKWSENRKVNFLKELLESAK